jgi:hypothetical protein
MRDLPAGRRGRRQYVGAQFKNGNSIEAVLRGAVGVSAVIGWGECIGWPTPSSRGIRILSRRNDQVTCGFQIRHPEELPYAATLFPFRISYEWLAPTHNARPVFLSDHLQPEEGLTKSKTL